MDLVHILPHVNASLNATAMVLLVLGYVFIKRGRSHHRTEASSEGALPPNASHAGATTGGGLTWHESAHKITMLACFGVSVVFLACYLTYHALKAGISTPFPDYPPVAVRYTYYAILLSHIVLAAVVPVLAVVSIVLGLRDRRASHRRWGWITLPIWLYVSITGVAVYVMLYHLYPPQVAS